MSPAEPDFRRIADLSKDGYFRFSFEEGIVYQNPGFARMIGWDSRKSPPDTKDLAEFVAPADAEELRVRIEELRSGHVAKASCVVRLKRRTDSPLWVELFLVAVPDDHSRAKALDGLARDVSEHLEVADLLSRRSMEQATLLKAQRDLLTTLDFDSTIDSIVNEAKDLLDARSAMLFLRRGEAGNLRPIAFAGELEVEIPSIELEIGEGLTGWVVAHGEPVRVDRLSADKRGIQTSKLAEIDGGLLAAPVQLGETIAGALTVLGAEGQYEDEDLSFLVALGQVASLALANSRTFQAVEELATVDGLTGSFNRRFFDENLPEELQRANRLGIPVGLLMIDVDGLKRVNDEHGHVVGDAVLRTVVRVATSRIRETDWVARYGGDEFVVVLPGSSASHLRVLGEKLLKEIRESSVETDAGEMVSVELSAGGAVRRQSGMAPQDLVRAADRAERKAKAEGGNRLVIAPANEKSASAPGEGS